MKMKNATPYLAAQMKNFWFAGILAVIGLTISLTACNGNPSEREASNYLSTRLEDQWGKGSKMVSFKKTNGLSLEKEGARNYELEFSAVVQAPEARPVEMTGVVTFIKTENGWLPINLRGETATHKAEQKQSELADRARTEVLKIETALQLYRLDSGSFPSQEQGLQALESAPTTDPIPKFYKPGGYLKLTLDPWGNPYQYRPGAPGQDPDVFSFGADGKEGGEDSDADVRTYRG